MTPGPVYWIYDHAERPRCATGTVRVNVTGKRWTADIDAARSVINDSAGVLMAGERIQAFAVFRRACARVREELERGGVAEKCLVPVAAALARDMPAHPGYVELSKFVRDLHVRCDADFMTIAAFVGAPWHGSVSDLAAGSRADGDLAVQNHVLSYVSWLRDIPISPPTAAAMSFPDVNVPIPEFPAQLRDSLADAYREFQMADASEGDLRLMRATQERLLADAEAYPGRATEGLTATRVQVDEKIADLTNRIKHERTTKLQLLRICEMTCVRFPPDGIDRTMTTTTTRTTAASDDAGAARTLLFRSKALPAAQWHGIKVMGCQQYFNEVVIAMRVSGWEVSVDKKDKE